MTSDSKRTTFFEPDSRLPVMPAHRRAVLRAVAVSLAFVAAWWVLDAIADAVIFRAGTVPQELLHPARRQLVLRAVVGIGILVFTAMHFRLREAHRRLAMFATAVEKAADAALWKDQSGRILYANETASRMLGYSREELMQMSLADLDPFLEPGEFENRWETFPREKHNRLERVHRAKSGRLIPVELTISYVEFEGHEYNCAFSRDMSERNAIEAALKKSQEGLVRAQRVARLGSFEWDIEKNSNEWSDEMFTLLGVAPQSIEPTNDEFFRFVHPDDRERVRDRLSQDFAALRPHLSVHRVIRADGTQIWVRCQGEFVLDDDGKPVRMAGTIQDVSDLKRVEEDLRERNRLKDLFTDIMRHDLINPASVVKTASELLLQIEEDATKVKLLGRIERGATKLIELCESAAKYAHIADVTQIDFGEYELGAILKESLGGFHAHLQEKRMTLRFELDRRYPARVNPLITDVFSNLVSNAIKYSAEGSAIEVSIRDEQDHWRVSVADHGPGIADEDKQRVFTRFERLEQLGVRGSGLGLAIAKQVVDLHHGRIWIEDNPGGGSVFCVEVGKGASAALERATAAQHASAS